MLQLIMASSTTQLWGGGFHEKTHEALIQMNRSITIDKALWSEDLQGSVVYAEALFNAGIIKDEELKVLLRGLQEIRNDWEKGTIKILDSDEDVHTFNERLLIEKIGSTGGKLHTGRSRNDQIALDISLWLKKAVMVLINKTVVLVDKIVECSVNNIDVIMPGYTHLQRAQPVRFSHWILSYGFFLQADVEKFKNLVEKVNQNMPLGSGALTGNPFRIDRERMAHLLGFTDITPNSIYAVSNRDHVSDFLYQMSLNAVHLSRLAEDLILYSTKEFGFLALSHAFSTGSSLMPNKRNPDSLELIRATAPLLSGNSTTFLSLMKGLPSGYNKDFQYDKKIMFDSFNQLCLALDVTIGVICTLKVNKEKCRESLTYDMLATDVAYYLTRKGIPFRKAHHLTSELVSFADYYGIGINEVSLVDLKKISPCFDEDILEIWDFTKSCEQYTVTGGTSKLSVVMQIKRLEEFVKAWKT